MEWDVEFTDEFERWWNGLSEDEQDSVDQMVRLLQIRGPSLGRPHADLIQSSRHSNMKELRVQHAGRPYRVLFAFDPKRCAILLTGGDKTGNDRWYEEFVPIADRLYEEHLVALEKEKKRMAKNFKELQAKMSQERRARNEAAAAKMIDEMALDELREARDLTQEQLARLLHVNQAAVSKMERRADMYITTLQGVIKAMGGRLEIRAVFPNGVVCISQFQDLRKRA